MQLYLTDEETLAPCRIARSALSTPPPRAVIATAGDRAPNLLASGYGLDLHPRRLGSGQCAQALFVVD